jgi:predicted nuclease with TOPRIM domain
MREEVQARLELLRKEWETGRARLTELERQQAQLGETMLRISGAIQVLEELLGENAGQTTAERQTDGAASSGEASEEVLVPGA